MNLFARLTSKFHFPSRQDLSLLTLAVVFFSCGQNARADLSFVEIWGRSGTVIISGSEPARWVLGTTDTDENVLYTQTNGPLGVNGVSAGFGLSINFNGFQTGFPGVDVADLGGDAITTSPHDLDAGTWAYGMAMLDWPGPLEFRAPIVESYFQIRLAGSSAVVQDTSLAQQAVLAGRWPSIDAYIEFDPGFAFYTANSNSPSGPSDFTGFVFPECSSATLMMIGLAMGLLRRK